MTSVLWFRRDLRIMDHPALVAATGDAHGHGTGHVVPLFVMDPVLLRSAGPVRLNWLRASLAALDRSVAGNLMVVAGSPTQVVPAVAHAAGAQSVHISADFGDYGTRRDGRVATASAAHDVRLVATGSPYTVDPGAVLTGQGQRYRVFTPYFRSWLERGWELPYPKANPTWHSVATAEQRRLKTEFLLPTTPSRDPGDPDPASFGQPISWDRPAAGEIAAQAHWREFLATGLRGYDTDRDFPARPGTSRMSAHLRWGEIHPRTLLADLAAVGRVDASPGVDGFRRQLAWRDFYADVWQANPTSTWQSLDRRFDDSLQNSTATLADQHFDAWSQGRTGYPMIDAGMRQLLAEGWMHNRVRMLTAAFLVKDLHLPWQRGAAWFMRWLQDGDAANNSQGWQWAAGCGTDAAPFHRIFNPVRQGLRFDPDGDYVRRWVPELRDLPGASAHEPWTVVGTLTCPPDFRYPDRIVDHDAERIEALARFRALPPRTR